MTKEEEEQAMTVEFLAIWTVMGIMEKHGYQCTCMKMVKRVSFLEPPVHQKKLVLTFVQRIKEKNTLFSTSQDLEK